MEEGKEKKFVCNFCYKTFSSGKALGGHIRIHSDRYNGNKKKRLVDQREKQKQQQVCCRKCRKKFISLKALRAHMACHREGDEILLDSQSDTESETSLAPTRKRSKRVMRRSNSKSFGNGSLSFDSEIDQQVQEAASTLMMILRDSSYKEKRNLVMNSLGDSSENDSEIVETKSSSGKKLKIFNVKSQVLETDKVADGDQLRSADDNGVILCDSDGSDSDYFMNGPKKSDSDISVDGSRRNTGFGSGFNNSLNSFRNGDEGGSKYETDSCEDTNSKIHRFRDSKSPMVKKAGGEEKERKSHECPICFKVFKSGQALDGHTRSHYTGNQEHNQVAEMRKQIDLNLPASSKTDDE